jgi:hypothetical protein
VRAAVPVGLVVAAVSLIVVPPPMAVGVGVLAAGLAALLGRAGRVVGWVALGLSLALVAYGLLVVEMHARSAARGGGLLGGLGEAIVGVGLVLAGVSAATLGRRGPRREG